MPPRIGQPRLLREINRGRVLLHLRDHGASSKTELGKALAFSKVTASSVVEELLEERRIQRCSSHTPKSEIQRNVKFQINETYGHAAVVDIDANEITILFVNLLGSEVSRCRFDTPKTASGLLRELIKRISKFGQTLRLLCVVVLVPAALDNEGNIANPGQPEYLAGLSLREALEQNTEGLKVIIENDLNAAALGELSHGAATSWKYFGFLAVRASGTGIGLVTNGRIYHGANGFAGEIGKLFDRRLGITLDAIGHSDDLRWRLVEDELLNLSAITAAIMDLQGFVYHAAALNRRLDLQKRAPKFLAKHWQTELNFVESQLGEKVFEIGGIQLAMQEIWREATQYE